MFLCEQQEEERWREADTYTASTDYWLRYITYFAELKHTLLHKCTTFLASRLVHRFLVCARCGSTRYHNALRNKINSDRTS